MKFSEKWLREWVDPAMDTATLAHRLTMAGHEVDAIETHGAGLDGVFVGEVISAGRHPDADRLSVCQVAFGDGDTVEVVCGAPNVVAGMKSPFAPAGTKLPNGVKLRKAKIRGVVSNGMLCSAIELGLGEESDGIIELPADATTGMPLTEYLDLPDHTFDLDLTPNRGDCFSVFGIARDVAAMTDTQLNDVPEPDIPNTVDDEQAIELIVPEGCPRFAGRVVRNIDPDAKSPTWLVEKLRRSGLRPIHPVVDITNFVMLELGQPLHAYDLAKVQGSIRPRLAEAGEKLTLLDEREVELQPNTLVITDDSGPIGMAGIMGGLSTAVSKKTTEVFFEAAFWPPEFMAGRARQYAMHTDASLRFERGVDPAGQARAVNRATQLLLDISGGDAGPLTDEVATSHLPERVSLVLRKSRLKKVLGTDIEESRVHGILNKLGLETTVHAEGWTVAVPSFRFDIDVEDALVEEVARIFGYDEIPEATAIAETPLALAPEETVDLDRVADTLVARDYQEVITYSFIDEELNELISGSSSKLKLSNPISSEMSVMRSSVWPGLLVAAASNVARQQERVRIFEIGKTFHGTDDAPQEVMRLAALAYGDVLPEQWGGGSQSVDFFDIKSDVIALLSMSGDASTFSFVAAEHAALQAGQTANILRENEVVGVIGKLHPRIAKTFDLDKGAFLFELATEQSFAASVPAARVISKFPAIRRDIAVVVADEILTGDLVEAVASVAPELIRNVRIFDVYKGPGIEAGLKSVALGLILQETSRTLTDDDADAAMAAAVRELQQKFAAVLRE